VLVAAFAAVVLLGAATACGAEDERTNADSVTRPSSSPRREAHPSGKEAAILSALVDFARRPTPAAWRSVPLADEVRLGLADHLMVRRSARQLREPQAWVLRTPKLFRAYVGPFSALQPLAERRPVRFTVGPHRHCVSPPVPPPRAVASLTRISVQPASIESCLQWFSVDAFVTVEGELSAITLDLWEP
jgi:hypothetical protein